MIDEALLFLRESLNTYFSVASSSGEPHEELVTFPEGQQTDSVSFKVGAVSLLLINIEEENIGRAPDPYSRISASGIRETVVPDIRLNLYVLFVAHFKEYQTALRYLSSVIGYFQQRRIFDHRNSPQLNDSFERLTMELITLPMSEQNEIWNALRVAYHPSVLYRVKMLVFQDEESKGLIAIKEQDLRFSQ